MGWPTLFVVGPVHTKSTLRFSASPADARHVRDAHRPSVPLGAAAEYDHSRQSQRLPAYRPARNVQSHTGLQCERPVTRSSPRGRASARANCEAPHHNRPEGRSRAVIRRSQPQDKPAGPRRVCGRHRTRGPVSPSAGPNERRSVPSFTAVRRLVGSRSANVATKLHWTGGPEREVTEVIRVADEHPANRSLLSPRASLAEHQPKPSPGRTRHPEGCHASLHLAPDPELPP